MEERPAGAGAKAAAKGAVAATMAAAADTIIADNCLVLGALGFATLCK